MSGRREFHFSQGTSHKFWAITLDGAAHQVEYGRLGTSGQTKRKSFASPAAASADAERLISQKVRKGYEEVASGSAGEAAAAKAEAGNDPLYLVYRSAYEGPSGKRVVSLKGGSALGWFQRLWAAANREDWIDNETKGGVYGMWSMQEAAQNGAVMPTDWASLEDVLCEHLYLEAGEPIVEEPTIRALTDDDEIELAYFFFTKSYADAHPERTAYLLQKSWKLPTNAANAGDFTPPFDLWPVTPAGGGEGTVYALSLDVGLEGRQLTDRLDEQGAYAIEGLRLPGLTAYLRESESGAEWPNLLLALRAATGARDKTVKEPLKRVGDYGFDNLSELSNGSYAEVRAELGKEWPHLKDFKPIHQRRGLVVSDHMAQITVLSEDQWTEQWILFDDLWATAHPDLAASLIAYATNWDPLRD